MNIISALSFPLKREILCCFRSALKLKKSIIAKEFSLANPLYQEKSADPRIQDN